VPIYYLELERADEVIEYGDAEGRLRPRSRLSL
jgi:hypothetical protein